MGRSIAPTENQLKAQLLNQLRRTKRISPSTILANELPLGATGVRADLALYSKIFTGIEIKSDRDSLKRLERQLAVYRSHFDRTILLLGSKHWEEALKLDLSGLELWIASGMAVRRVQQGSIVNQGKNQAALVASSVRSKYYNTSAKEIDEARIFPAEFSRRFRATSDTFWSATRDRPILTEDLALLSRFIDKREQSQAMAEESKKARQRWLDSLAQSVHSSSVSKKDASSS